MVCVCALFSLTGCYNTEPRESVLKIYNWADYIDEDMLAEFPRWYKEQTGEDIRIVYQTFDINEIMLTKIERGHEDFDVVCPSEYIIERMLRKGLLLPIDTVFGKTPNYLHNESPYIREQLDKLSWSGHRASDYAIGYMWGTAGILFNTDHVPAEDARTWASLWNLKYENKILMKESYRDAYGTALIYANAEDLKKGKVTVEELMNNYSQASIDTVEKYEVPVEGSNVWYDGWVIPKYARNKKAASYFINYLCRPDVALRNMDACGYVSAVATPEILEAKIDTTLSYFADLSYFFGPAADSIQIDKVQYPDRTVVERCAMIRDSGDKTELVLEMWSRVKGDNLGVGVVIVILVSAGIMVVFTVYRKLQRYQHEKAQYRRRNHRRKK